MGVKHTQRDSGNFRDTLAGWLVSGKVKSYHSGAFGATLPGGGSSSYPEGHTATGGIISDWLDPSPGNVYRTHIFASSGTFDVTALSSKYPANVEYLVVAGGGGGGGQHGGGGGAGGLRTNLTGHPLAGSAFPVSVSPYTVTVGAGGARQISTPPHPYAKNSTSGGDSVFGSITSAGGGTGGNWCNTTGYSDPRQVGSAGGSGGGSGSNESDTQAPTAYRGAGNTPPQSPSQGYPGGQGRYGGGGGGGAGGAASPNPPASPYGGGYGGDGGAGVQVVIAGPAANIGIGQTQGWFSGGGGGGSYQSGPNPNTPDNRPAGGIGGGGKGGFSGVGQDATVCTGGGGGGGGNSPQPGGSGGSGIVAVRYQIGATAPTAKATGGAISLYGGKWIHTFTTSGTFATSFSWNNADSVEYLIIAGGGSGGGKNGGAGGGAGGVVPGTTTLSHPTSYAVTVGAGGGSVDSGPANGAQGTPSVFGPGPISATAGGYGGNGVTGGVGGAGGSGGGGGEGNSGGAGTNFPGPTQQGYPGGSGFGGGSQNGGGGGGGFGGAGADGTSTAGGAGGIGAQLPTTFRNPASATSLGTPGPAGSYYVAGGGGGGTENSSGSVAGGSGGGGAAPGTGSGVHGSVNTGGGGGGASIYNSPGTFSGSGGSGIVIIAYPE